MFDWLGDVADTVEGWFGGGSGSSGGSSWWDPIINFGTKYLGSSGGTGTPTWLDKYGPMIGLGSKLGGSILDWYNKGDALDAQKDAMDKWMAYQQAVAANNYSAYQNYVNQWYGQPGGNGAPSGYTLVGTDPAEIDAARIGALQEAQARLEAGYSDALATLAPYRKVAYGLAPKMSKVYKQGLRGISQMYNDLFNNPQVSPEATSALAQKLGFADFMRGKGR